MMDNETRHAQLFVSLETLLLKKVNASPEALFLNLERRLYQRAQSTFHERAQSGVTAALAGLTGDNIASVADVQRIQRKLASAFRGWDGDVRPLFTAVTRQAFIESKRQIILRAHGKLGPVSPEAREWPQLVQKAPRKEVSLQPSFTLQDEQAIDQMVKNQLYWIGESYDNNLADSIDDVVRSTMLESGLGRAEAGRQLRLKLEQQLGLTAEDLPAGWQGRVGQYFEGISANAVTNARTGGAIGQMRELKVTRYTIQAVGDERTCDRCLFMDQQTFAISVATDILDRIAAAETPDDVRDAHPWAKSVEQMSGSPERFALPPFHFICRCGVDIAEDAEFSWD